MQRRALLRAGVALGTGAGLLGRGRGHPTPTGTTETPPTESSESASPAGDAYGPLGNVAIDGATEAVVSGDGHYVYVAATTGYAVVDVGDPSAPETVAERRNLLAGRENGPLSKIFDVKQDGDTLLVVGPANAGGEKALSGMLVVDVADPANPKRRAFFETDYPIHNCSLAGGTAYLTANGSDIRLEMVDVSGGDPSVVGSWSLLDVDERWEDVNRGLRICHDVYVRDGVAYVAHWDAGAWLVDVSDPDSPAVISHVADWTLEELLKKSGEDGDSTERITLPGNAHHIAVDEGADLMGVGREAWAVETDPDGGPGGIDLFDVSTPEAPEKVASIEPPETPDASIRGTWTTSHNFDLREGILYSSWYRGGVKRHDVSDPANPKELTWWADAEDAMFWTAQASTPGESFVASSLGRGEAEAGLYTFPDEAGRSVSGLGGGPTTTETANETATATPTPTPTRAATTRRETPSASPTETETESPGFGLLTGLTGLAGLGAGALARRRRSDG